MREEAGTRAVTKTTKAVTGRYENSNMERTGQGNLEGMLGKNMRDEVKEG